MYKCSKCGIIFNDIHKDFDCREELISNITAFINKFSINQLLMIYNFIKSNMFNARSL